jgi:hypothetical protein
MKLAPKYFADRAVKPETAIRTPIWLEDAAAMKIHES